MANQELLLLSVNIAESISRQQQRSTEVVLDAIVRNPVQPNTERLHNNNGPQIITIPTEPAYENLDEINFMTNILTPVETMNCPAYNRIPAMANQPSSSIQ